MEPIKLRLTGSMAAVTEAARRLQEWGNVQSVGELQAANHMGEFRQDLFMVVIVHQDDEER